MSTLIALVAIILAIGALYLLSIKPRMHGRPDYKPFFGHMYAHRGLHLDYPENSLSAIKLAADNGYGIEFDVHLTKDNIPVIFHDDTLNRMCSVKGYLRDYTYAQLMDFRLMGTDERIPKLEDVLKMVDGRVPLIIEYKVEKNNASRLCRICDDLLSKYNGIYCIQSFHPMAVRWYRIHRPSIVRGQLSEDFTKQKLNLPYFLLSHLIGNCYASPDFISYNCKHKNELSRNICRKFYKSLSVAWTVRSQEELERISRSFDLFIFEGFLPKTGFPC
jgi:glycerophosphoryl diester phosphodiesterase